MQKHRKRLAIAAVFRHIKDHAMESIADFFAWWAAFVYDNPYWCIIATLSLTLLCSAGFLPGIPTWVDGAEALYSLPFSVARSEGIMHKVLFNETRTRPTFVVVTSQNEGENILTWEHLEAVRQLDYLIRGMTVDPKLGRRIGIPKKLEYNHFSIEDQQRRHSSGDKSFLMNSSLMESNDIPTIRNTSNNRIMDTDKVFNLINDASTRVHSSRGGAGDDILTFQDICAKNPFGECTVASVLEMGVFDLRHTLLTPEHPPMLFLFDGLVFNTRKKAFPPHYLLGQAVESFCHEELPKKILTLYYNESQLEDRENGYAIKLDQKCIREAKAFQLIYEVADKEGYRSRNEDWEKIFVDILGENMRFGPLNVTMNAFRSRDDALRSSTSESSDILFVGLTFAFIVLYSTGLNFSCDLYRSKAYPALAGVMAAILGMISGMGFISLCGISFVPTALVCPFLVVGVGTDDMFVIINGYSLAYMVDSARDRCILSLRDTGLAISITTLTSLVSFFIGLNTGYLSIRNFCYFCGAGMFFGYLYVLTFFFAFHCLDARREEENHACFLCFSYNGRREARRQELMTHGVLFTNGAEISTFTLGALMVRRAEHNAVREYSRQLQLKQKVQLDDSYPTQVCWLDNDIKKGSQTPDSVITGPDSCSDHKQLNNSYFNERESSVDIHNLLSTKSVIPLSKRLTQFFLSLHHSVNDFFNYLLARIALDAHHVAKHRDIDLTPSNAVLLFSPNKFVTNKEDIPCPTISILNESHIPLYYSSLMTGQSKLFIEEPKGSVGLKWRKFLIKYYGPSLMHPVTKIIILVLFGVFIMISIYGCTQLETGLELKDLAPIGSYLNKFDIAQAEYFNEYDFPVDVFFPQQLEWWRLDAQQTMRDLETIMRQSGAGKLVTNPFIRMLDDPVLEPFLKSGVQEIFESTLHNALSDERGKYKQFEQNFVWEGNHLRAWKMQILPAAMMQSTERAIWMARIRNVCIEQSVNKYPMAVMAWNYMMTFYESDLQINSSVITNMIVAALIMLIISILGIPQIVAGFLVIIIMAMIDIGIVGFMYFWNVRLNMVSMICLLISVGFSVDFSAHVCHTFMEAEGQTRNQRVIETLVLMGNPVFHGAASSILGVLMLAFSESYIFQVFFKMMTLVMVFALIHSVVFLPVLLSFVGSAYPHQDLKKTKGLYVNHDRDSMLQQQHDKQTSVSVPIHSSNVFKSIDRTRLTLSSADINSSTKIAAVRKDHKTSDTPPKKILHHDRLKHTRHPCTSKSCHNDFIILPYRQRRCISHQEPTKKLKIKRNHPGNIKRHITDHSEHYPLSANPSMMSSRLVEKKKKRKKRLVLQTTHMSQPIDSHIF